MTVRFSLKIHFMGDQATYPTDGDTVDLHYVAMFLNGVQFDATHAKSTNNHLTFDVGTEDAIVIAGWDEAIKHLPLGATATLTVPADLAYGQEGLPGIIPPHSDLMYDLEIVGINGKTFSGPKTFPDASFPMNERVVSVSRLVPRIGKGYGKGRKGNPPQFKVVKRPLPPEGPEVHEARRQQALEGQRVRQRLAAEKRRLRKIDVEKIVFMEKLERSRDERDARREIMRASARAEQDVRRARRAANRRQHREHERVSRRLYEQEQAILRRKKNAARELYRKKKEAMDKHRKSTADARVKCTKDPINILLEPGSQAKFHALADEHHLALTKFHEEQHDLTMGLEDIVISQNLRSKLAAESQKRHEQLAVVLGTFKMAARSVISNSEEVRLTECRKSMTPIDSFVVQDTHSSRVLTLAMDDLFTADLYEDVNKYQAQLEVFNAHLFASFQALEELANHLLACGNDMQKPNIVKQMKRKKKETIDQQWESSNLLLPLQAENATLDEKPMNVLSETTAASVVRDVGSSKCIPPTMREDTQLWCDLLK